MPRLFDTLTYYRRSLVVTALAVIVVGILLLVGVPWGIHAFTISQLERLTGQKVNLDDVSIHYLDRVLTMSGIRVVDQHSGQPIVAIHRVQAHFRLWSLWQQHIRVPQLVIDDPTVVLIRAADGGWNMSQQDPKEGQPASGSSGFTVELQDVQLKNGTLTYQDFTLPRNPRIQVKGIDLRLSDVLSEKPSPIPVHLTAFLTEHGTLNAHGVMHVAPFSLETEWDIRNVPLASLQDFVPGFPPFSGTLQGTVDLRIPSDEQTDLFLQGKARVEDFELGTLPSPLLTAQQVEFTGVDLSWPDHLNMAQIHAQHVSMDIVRDAQGTFPVLKEFQAAKPQETPSDSGQPDFALNIDQLHLQDGAIRFIDRTTQPEYQKTLSQIGVTLKGLTTDSGQVGRITVEASTPDKASLHLEGDIGLPDNEFFLDVEGAVKGFVISSVNPYAERWIGWGTRSGRLSTDIRLRIENRHLQAKSKMGISDLRVVRTGSEDVIATELGLPLGLIVDLIKNVHGNIHVKFEVEGPLDQPEFSIRDAIWKSLRNAVVNIVTAPLRLIGRLVTTQSKIQTIDIEPILFVTGTKTMVDGMDERIRHFQKFLKTTPYIGLTVFPVISAGDLHMLRIRAVTSRIAELESREPTLDLGEGSLAIYRETFPEKDPPDEEAARIKHLVAVEPVPENRVAELASERVRIFIGRITGSQAISSDRIQIGKQKKRSDEKDLGGLEFSITR